jgi:signal peptidase I
VTLLLDIAPDVPAGLLDDVAPASSTSPASHPGLPAAGRGHTGTVSRPDRRRGRPVPRRRPVRRARVDRARAVRVALWSVVVVCAGAYAASLLVPLWYGLHDQRLLVVTSGSMAPAFHAGDAVVLQQIDDPSELRTGQVVSFWPPGSDELVTHRIQDLTRMPVLEQDESTGRMVPVLDPAGEPILREHLITQGDANPVRDPDAVPVSRVRGVVLTAHSGWGALLSWTHSDLGRLVMLAPPLAALAGMEIASLVQARRERPAGAGDRDRERADDLLLD